jgi:hypothetical protein
MWHGYIGIEVLTLTSEQRAAIAAALRGLGPASDPQPCHVNHWRIALDGNKAIFEALFDEAHLTVQHVKEFLADAVGVSPAVIDDRTAQSAYGPVVTYVVGGVDRIRFLVFGGRGVSWPESRAQAAAYMAATSEEWE